MISILATPGCNRSPSELVGEKPGRVDAIAADVDSDENEMAEIDAIARAALELARESGGVRALASICEKGNPPSSVIVYRDHGRKLYLGAVAGQKHWTIDGPSSINVDIRPPPLDDTPDMLGIRAGIGDLIVEIKRTSPARADVHVSTGYLCGEHGLRVDKTDREWLARWLDDRAYSPPEKWECRRDDDCPAAMQCVWSWTRWDRSRHAWVGRAGVCLSGGKPCKTEKQCRRGEMCAGPGPVVSDLTGLLETTKRCRKSRHDASD